MAGILDDIISSGTKGILDGTTTGGVGFTSGVSYDPVRSFSDMVGSISKIPSSFKDDPVNFDRLSILDSVPKTELFGVTFPTDEIPFGDWSRAIGGSIIDELSTISPEQLARDPGGTLKKFVKDVGKDISREYKQRSASFTRGVLQDVKDTARSTINALLTGKDLKEVNLGVTDSRLLYTFAGPKEISKTHKKSESAPDMKGVNSVINSYEVFRLERVANSGGSDSTSQNRFLLDKEQRKGYTSEISKNPTLGNILKRFGQIENNPTPYKAADFLWCKYYKRIPNTHLITLRRFLFPVNDNLTISPYVSKKALSKGAQSLLNNNQQQVPIAQMVTYYGPETGNDLSILNFVMSIPYSTLTSDVQTQTFKLPDAFSILNNMPTLGKIGQNIASTQFGSFSKALTNITNALGEDRIGLIGAALGLGDPVRLSGLQSQIETYDPYAAGGPLSDRIYGPVNVINSTYRRERGLSGTMSSLNIKFAYSLKAIGHLNAKAVMLDIMSNIMATTYFHARFWGGTYRFFTDKGRWPLGNVEYMEALYKGEFNKASELMKKNFQDIINSISDKISSSDISNSSALNSILNFNKKDNKNNSNIINNSNVNVNSGAQFNFFEGNSTASNLFESFTNAAGPIANRSIDYSIFEMINGIGLFRPQVTALKTGAPVGDWHLTIGNPFNPIVRIGNLICKSTTISFNNILGPDDFPTEMYANVQLEMGRPRDASELQSIFNDGYGRMYYPSKITDKDVDDSIQATTNSDIFDGETSSQILDKTGISGMGTFYNQAKEDPTGISVYQMGNKNNIINTNDFPITADSVIKGKNSSYNGLGNHYGDNRG